METITKNRVTSSEAKALSTSDKTEKGSSNADTSASAAPMKMVKPNKTRVENLPLTPPDEKRSVSFDLHSNTTLQIPYENTFYPNSNGSNGFATSPAESIDIAVRELSEDVCVSLMKRHVEMKELVDRNKDFFDKVKQISFEDENDWKNFLKVLYSKRDEKRDHQWMDEISEFLSNNPPFLATFKQIIGYYENDDATDSVDNDANNDADYFNNVDFDDIQEEHYESCAMNDHVYIDVTPIRRFPNKLENLEKFYPVFFDNVKQLLNQERQRRGSAGSALGGNHLSDDNPNLHPVDVQSEEPTEEKPYDEFIRILKTPTDVMDDDEWETAIYECLDPSQDLVSEFEYMICHEIPEE